MAYNEALSFMNDLEILTSILTVQMCLFLKTSQSSIHNLLLDIMLKTASIYFGLNTLLLSVKLVISMRKIANNKVSNDTLVECFWGAPSPVHIDGLVQERRNSSALAMKLRLSCSNPSIYEQLKKTQQIIIPCSWYFTNWSRCNNFDGASPS